MPGISVDVGRCFSLDNLIPGTGLMTVKKDHTNDVTEVIGPAASLAESV